MPDTQFADIILPLALRGRFTYRIPGELVDRVKPGVRVLVQFGGRQFYSGIVCSIHDRSPEIKNIRTITRVLDEIPLINESQLKLWFWISDYYLCGEGEVMKAALPSETSINSYKPRFETFVKLARQFSEKELNEILDNLSKARKQQELLTTYLSLTGYGPKAEISEISKSVLLSESQTSMVILNALTGKGILKSFSLPVSRISEKEVLKEPVKILSEAQSNSLQFNTKPA